MYNPTFYSFIDDKNNKDHLESSWLQLFQPNVLKPFRLLLIYFFFANILSGVPYSPYLTEVFTTFGADADVQWTIVSAINIYSQNLQIVCNILCLLYKAIVFINRHFQCA